MWWSAGGDLYLDGFAEAGFEVVSTDPTEHARAIEPGDVFLRRVMSKKINHGGVYIGDGLMIEQLPKSLVARRPIAGALPLVNGGGDDAAAPGAVARAAWQSLRRSIPLRVRLACGGCAGAVSDAA